MSDKPSQEIPAVEYPKLPPRPFGSLSPTEYIDQRLNQTISWYDAKSVISKKRYLLMRAFSVIGGALVPVLVNVDVTKFPYVDYFATAISIMVVLLVSLESVFHYREQWVNYRSTEQYLRKEYFLFTAKEGVYADIHEEADAFMTFVERVEQAIDVENASTLQVMTATSEAGKAHERSRGAAK